MKKTNSSKLFSGTIVLLILAVLLPSSVLAQSLTAVSLSLEKATTAPGEKITVYFNVRPALPANAWIGIIPSAIAHGSENLNDQHDMVYQYLGERTSGEMAFTAPSAPGSYDFRLNSRDEGGVELAFVSFTVAGTAPTAAAPGAGEPTLRLDNDVFAPGQQISVRFTASAAYANDAWVGIIPSHVPHGNEAVNDGYDLTYQYLSKRTSGVLIFQAPGNPGSYDFRMHDTDANGREVTSVTFTVR